jgi:hypothetical protein
MVNKSQNQKKSKFITGMIIIIIVFLGISIGILLSRREEVLQPRSVSQVVSSVNTEGWLNYEDGDLPFIFQYPDSLNFKKNTTSQKHPQAYAVYSLSGNEVGEKESIVNIRYKDGYDSLADHANECFQYRDTEKLQDIKVSNKLTGDESIQICGERKRWEYSYDNGKKEIEVVSYKGMEISVFKAIVESLDNK